MEFRVGRGRKGAGDKRLSPEGIGVGELEGRLERVVEGLRMRGEEEKVRSPFFALTSSLSLSIIYLYVYCSVLHVDFPDISASPSSHLKVVVYLGCFYSTSHVIYVTTVRLFILQWMLLRKILTPTTPPGVIKREQHIQSLLLQKSTAAAAQVARLSAQVREL